MERIRGALDPQHAGGAERFGGARDGPGVAGVLQFVEDYDQAGIPTAPPAKDIRCGPRARLHEARPADVILVLGAAEYRGRPSPVLRARLDHALELYNRKMAPRIMTTGGAGGERVFTEGTVGRAYLTGHGVPPEAVIVESEGETTVQSTMIAVEIMLRMELHTVIVVSDGYHIFLVKRMLQARGVTAYG